MLSAQSLSLTPNFSWVYEPAGDAKTVSTVSSSSATNLNAVRPVRLGPGRRCAPNSCKNSTSNFQHRSLSAHRFNPLYCCVWSPLTTRPKTTPGAEVRCWMLDDERWDRQSYQ